MKERRSSRAEALTNQLVGGKYSELATYADLFQRTSDGIFLIDLDTHQVLECNPSAAKLVGLDEKKVEHQDFLRWFDQPTQDALRKLFKRLSAENGRYHSLDASMKSARGEALELALTAGHLRLGDYCELIQVLAKDMTAERHAENELREANRKLTMLSTTDEMTKLYNFRYFSSELRNEHERATRYKQPYTVILCDLDHFKHFNDKNSHTEGDEALRHVAQILRRRARKTDVVARYGGEEFVVLCPQMSSQEAQVLAEALRVAVAGESFRHGERQPLGRVTISVGLAHFPAHGKTPEEILRRAEEALCASKAAGRNQTTIYRSELVEKKKSA